MPEQSKAYSTLGEKKVSDLITPDTFVDRHGGVYGTLKYVSGWTQFNQSDANEQSGNYFPIDLGDKYKGQEITCEGKNKKTAEDTEWVLRVENNDSTFKFSTGDKEILNLNFKNTNLEKNSAPASATVMAKKSTRAVAKKNTTDETLDS